MAEGVDFETLTDAMLAGDELAEAVMRYQMLDETFRDAAARERKSLSLELNSLMEKITRLRANTPAASTSTVPGDVEADKFGQIVPFDASRFRKAETPREEAHHG